MIGTPYKEYAERISEALEKKIPMPALEDRKEWDGFICPVSLMIISLIINLTADSSYSSMAVLHKEGGGYRFFC